MSDEDKKFTQAELDSHIEARLARERTKHDNEIKTLRESFAGEKAPLETKIAELESFKGTVAEKDKIYEDLHTGFINSLPDDKKKLIPESLPKHEQVKHILNNKEFFLGASSKDTETTVVIPDSDKKSESDKGLKKIDLKGHPDEKTFALRDHVGYREEYKKAYGRLP